MVDRDGGPTTRAIRGSAGAGAAPGLGRRLRAAERTCAARREPARQLPLLQMQTTFDEVGEGSVVPGLAPAGSSSRSATKSDFDGEVQLLAPSPAGTYFYGASTALGRRRKRWSR